MAVTRVKQGLMTLAILVVLTVFVFYGISVFYEAPEWSDYCGERSRSPKLLNTQESCASQGGLWESYDEPVPCPEGQDCPQGWCDLYHECQEAFDEHRDVYERNVSFVGLIIGLGLLFLGLYLKGASVSTGIMGGGVLIMFVSLVRYWGYLSKYARLILLAVILGLLIWVGYSKIDNFKEQPVKRKVTKKTSRKSSSKRSTKKKSKKSRKRK